MRLTDKISLGKFGQDNMELFGYDNKALPNQEMHSSVFNILDKLGQLEDKEELYGIDLLTLLETETVFWRIKYIDNLGYSEIQKSYECHIDLRNHRLIVYTNEFDEIGFPLYFKDYGKTWALYKEELEKDYEKID